jgi:hypothetical protein
MNDASVRIGYLAIGAQLSVASLLKLMEFEYFKFSQVREQVGAALIWAELFAAVLCFVGYKSELFRGSLAVFFSAGIAFNLRSILNGDSDCGCFGTLQVPPQYTLILDVLALLFLLFLSYRNNGLDVSHSDQRQLIYASAIISTAIVFSTVLTHPSNFVDGDTNQIEVNTGSMRGKRFNLALDIAGGAELLQGDWRVVFVRANCQACKEHMDKLTVDNGEKLAIVEVPPLGASWTPPEASVVTYLNPKKRWLVQTPSELKVNSGFVN